MTKYDFFNLFADGITAPEKLTKEWVYQNVYLPNPPYSIKGSCDLSISPYLIEPLKSFADPSINEIYIAATPRTGKSLFEDLLLLYTLKEQPSDILLALDTKAKANLWYKTRLRRLFEANNIKLSDDRFDTTKSCIVLDSCTIRFAGAKEEGDLSSFPSKIVLGDECWDWKKGMLAKAKTRSRDWGEYGRKNVFVSQASSAGSDFCEGWHRGQQSKFGFRCVHCGKEQVFSFTKPVKSGDGIRYAGLNWDPSAKLKSGRWDVEKAKATVFYACEQCEHRYLWTPEDRRTLASNYVYIKHNDNPETNVASYSWNCFSAPDKYPWGDIVSEWLGAVNTNNKKNRKNFYIQWMSEFHNPTMEEEELVPLISANVSASIEPASGSLYRYEVADIHRTEDKKIFMCFDVNKETKTIDLIKYGVVHAWNELETIRQDLSIRPRRVLVDSGDQTTTVYKQCGLRGEWVKTKTGNIRWSSWIPCKGREGRDDFKHIKDGVGRFYSPPSPKDTGINEDGKRQIGLCLFATDAVKDIADDLLKKKHHEWTLRIPETAANDDVLIKSLNSEKLEKVENKRRGGYDERWVRKSDFNHYFDCLCLLIVGMGKDHLI